MRDDFAASVSRPIWLAALVANLSEGGPPSPDWVSAAPTDARTAAVLVLLTSTSDDNPAVLLLERAAALRSHAGQAAFPGGAVEPDDAGPVETALREATEEVGLDPTSVEVLGQLPGIWVPPSNYVVTPVVAWWHAPHRIWARDRAEVARVFVVSVATLADPARRQDVRLGSGRRGPAFQLDGLLVWGFTGGVLDMVLRLGGWAPESLR